MVVWLLAVDSVQLSLGFLVILVIIPDSESLLTSGFLDPVEKTVSEHSMVASLNVLLELLLFAASTPA